MGNTEIFAKEQTFSRKIFFLFSGCARDITKRRKFAKDLEEIYLVDLLSKYKF